MVIAVANAHLSRVHGPDSRFNPFLLRHQHCEASSLRRIRTVGLQKTERSPKCPRPPWTGRGPRCSSPGGCGGLPGHPGHRHQNRNILRATHTLQPNLRTEKYPSSSNRCRMCQMELRRYKSRRISLPISQRLRMQLFQQRCPMRRLSRILYVFADVITSAHVCGCTG